MEYTKISNLKQYNAYCEELQHLIMNCDGDDETTVGKIEKINKLMGDYDNNCTPESDMDSLDILRESLEDNDLNTTDLGHILMVSPEIATEIFTGRKHITKEQSLLLSDKFNKDSGTFDGMLSDSEKLEMGEKLKAIDIEHGEEFEEKEEF